MPSSHLPNALCSLLGGVALNPLGNIHYFRNQLHQALNLLIRMRSFNLSSTLWLKQKEETQCKVV
jgi:hypothetical protein